MSLPPNEEQISECISQIIQKQQITHSEKIQGYAQLRLADFSGCLTEWGIDLSHISPELAALPQVANAIKQVKLPTDQIKKLTDFIKINSKNGQQTAQLYWAYLLATGRHGVTQNPIQAAEIARQLQEKNDWRGTRFLGEMLTAAPQAAADLLAYEIQSGYKAYQTAHPETPLNDIMQHAKKFTTAPAAMKHAAKIQFETAIKQGSPTAAQRLKGLVASGQLSSNQPPKAYHSLNDWLTAQLQKSQYATVSGSEDDDPDILVLPENMPLILTDDTKEETLVWHKVATIGGVFLCMALILTILVRVMIQR